MTLEVNAPSAGTLSDIKANEGAEVEVGAMLGTLEDVVASADNNVPSVENEKIVSQNESDQALSTSVCTLRFIAERSF